MTTKGPASELRQHCQELEDKRPQSSPTHFACKSFRSFNNDDNYELLVNKYCGFTPVAVKGHYSQSSNQYHAVLAYRRHSS